ncbi:hypothetical protein [Glacieibacterium frigidum]|uniref:Uncharacterized protein n=1 Tax=Glacieibacterium frigidum TaxID=2593303 RepID=A0A552U8B4_9SPHN|nr:hypothetical protein [Glacieibacterium frigidum]TRW14458.1 hypothetical protein FMM06_12175 [Glacieibacterium frigidum]
MAGRFASIADLIRSVRQGTLVSDARLFGELGDFTIDDGPDVAAALWRARAVRPEDMVVLDFTARGLRRQGDKLIRSEAGQPGVLIVTHQPQSIADGAYLDTTGQPEYSADTKLSGRETIPPSVPPVNPPVIPPGTENYTTPVPLRAAGPSRLAFTMPASEESLPLTLDALLDACRRWPLALDGAARPDGGTLTILEQWATVSTGLDFTLRGAREALAGALPPRLIAGLDAAAGRIASEQVASVRAKRPFVRRSLDAATTREVTALVSGTGEAVENTRAAATLYLNLASGARSATEFARAGIALEEATLLAPGLVALLQKPHEPSKYRTAIEMPWRLIGSPLADAGFTHATQPVTHGNRTELWHTRMGERSPTRGGVRIDERATSKFRYLWSPDYPAPSLGPTFSLDGKDRQMIVKLTAGYDEKNAIGGADFKPRAVNARRVMLSALGGQLEADRRWTTRPPGVDMMAWTHKLSQGRDSFVRVEYAGFLFPFGHAATLVKISERKFEWRGGAAAKDRVAVLRQRFFLIIREKSRTYPDGAPQPEQGRTMPFARVDVMLDVTPDLAQPGKAADQALVAGFYNADILKRMAFWPAPLSNPSVVFNFPLVGVDDAGNRVSFAMPLMFVSEVVNIAGKIEQVRSHYNGAPRLARRTADTRGALIRFAPARSGATDVDMPTNAIVFESELPSTGVPPGQSTTLQQQPIVKSATIRLAGAERLTGQAIIPEVEFDPVYIAHGFGEANKGELFLKLTTPKVLGFGASGTGSDAVGGVAAPSLNPSKLSAAHGVMSGLSDFTDGLFKPVDFFPDAKLLGFFSLKDILKPVVALGPESPQLTSTDFPAVAPKPAGVETIFRLGQQLPNSSIPALITNADGAKSRLDLTSVMRVYAGAVPPEQSVEGIITNFKINLAGCIIIHFDRLRFLKKSGAKPDVDVDLNPDTGVTFGGPLEFMNRLKDFIPANGFSDPPDLQVTPQGITAGYSLGLPNVQVGVLSLSNITLGAAFSLPFTGGAPTARFNFAERHNTFNLTVSLLGGGGFFAIVVGADGIKEIEAQLDFGAQVAIDLGVASGSVYIKAGFYFHYALSPERIEFEGFVELGGRLSVLGLISVSLTFHLSLAYEAIEDGTKSDGTPAKRSRLFGQATLVVEIEILFFSASVKVKVEKTFVGSDADPSFAQLIDRDAWTDYCSAYA